MKIQGLPCLALNSSQASLHSNRGVSQIGTHSGLSEDLKDLTRKPEILSCLHFDSVYKHRYWEEEGEGEGEEDIIEVTTVGLKIRGQPGNIDT